MAAGGRTVLISHPHNPLGRVFDRHELAGLTAVVARHGGRVIADEIHAPLAFLTAPTCRMPPLGRLPPLTRSP